MSWSRFFACFLLIVLLSYARSQLTSYPIEFSFFLIFLILRSSSIPLILVQTFVLSLGLDLIFQTGHFKGLAGMGQLFLVFSIIKIRRYVIPLYEDFFLIGAFGLFYVANYYINGWLSRFLGGYYEVIGTAHLIFFAALHSVFFGLLLILLTRFKSGKK